MPVIDSMETGLCNLPPFPTGALKLLQLSDPETLNLKAVHPILTSDPALAAEVLRLANSPLFGFSCEIHSVDHALALLGFFRVKTLVIAIAAKSYWVGADQSIHHQCWSHCVATAVVGEELASSFVIRKEDAFTAGLLHDLGRIALLKAYPKEYRPLLTADYRNFQESLTAENWSRLDHCEAGGWLAKTWAFPRPLQVVAREHHQEIEPAEKSLASLVRTACLFADALGFGELSCRQCRLDEALALLPGPWQEQFAQRIPLVEQRIVERIEHLAI